MRPTTQFGLKKLLYAFYLMGALLIGYRELKGQVWRYGPPEFLGTVQVCVVLNP